MQMRGLWWEKGSKGVVEVSSTIIMNIEIFRINNLGNLYINYMQKYKLKNYRIQFVIN